MQTAKKVLLTLICIFSALLSIDEIFTATLDVIDPTGFEGDKGIQIIFAWVVSVAFLLAFISSLCWITNVGNGFWLWKIPALIILPFSIPFLIIDFIQSRKPKEVVEQTIKKEKESTLLWIVFAIGIIVGIVALIFAIGEAFWNLFVSDIAKKHSLDVSMTVDWIILGIGITIGVFLIVGSIFLVINNYNPKKIFKVLSWFGFPITWFYLIIKIIDQKETDYLFKTKVPMASSGASSLLEA